MDIHVITIEFKIEKREFYFVLFSICIIFAPSTYRTMEQIKGKISQIIGPVVDVQFSAEKLPRIHDALTI